MPDMVAIISRAVYDRDFPGAKLGAVVALEQYVSTNAALTKLSSGGRLFLLAVRPPDEALWLMGVLEQPRFDGARWVAAPNTVPVTELTSLRGQLKFENGKGLPAEKGKLGMSLQTPRVLHADDVAAIEAVLGGVKPADGKRASIILNEHVTQLEPCLCKACLPNAPVEFELEGQRFVRRWVSAKGRALHFWVPLELADEPALLSSVRSKLLDKLERRRGWKKQPTAPAQVTTRRVEFVAPELTPRARAEERPRPSDVEAKPATGLGGWLKKLFGG